MRLLRLVRGDAAAPAVCPVRRPLVFAILFVLCAGLTAQAQPPSSPAVWVGTWADSPYNVDPWHQTPTLIDSTLRQIVHTSIAGKSLRVRFTNEFGTEPLHIGAASVALSPGTSAIESASAHPLTFGGQTGIVIPPGALALSDPVELATPAFANLAISIYLPVQQITNATFHGFAAQDNYIQSGNEVTAPSLSSPMKVSSWYFLKGVDVQPASPQSAVVVAFGDSITDGAHSAENENHRWPDYLATRLHNNPATANLSVLNEGIGGNCVLIGCIGPNALARFDRDVLANPDVKYVIVLEGINDIGALHKPNQPNYNLTAQDLEQGMMQLIARAHEHGIKIFGATLTPYQGAGYYTDRGEQVREAFNTWIRTSGAFDGVIDFDKTTADPQHPLVFAPRYDSGDHLHPKDAGYDAMANAIDLSLFQ
jgi:lysophospholipase L1-like esterase